MQETNSLWQLSWGGWRHALRRTFSAMSDDHQSLIAAACAFYAMGSVFPAISMLLAIYGLMYQATSIEPSLRLLQGLIPAEVFGMLQQWIHSVLYQSFNGRRMAISSGIAMVSAAGGVRALMRALNIANHTRERRHTVRLFLVSLVLTIGALLVAALTIWLVVALPEVMRGMGLDDNIALLLRVGGIVVALLCVMVAIALLYRFGPTSVPPHWSWISPGSAIATLIWVIGSELFSIWTSYAARFSSGDGPQASALLMMSWFYLSAYALLLGGELNAQLDRKQRETAANPSAGTPNAQERGA